MDQAPGTPNILEPQRAAPEAAEKQLKIFSGSRKGEEIPNHPDNQDAVLRMEERRVFGVFDGMGGYAGGETASRLTKEKVEEIMGGLRDDLSVDELKEWMKRAFEEAHSSVRAEAKRDPQKRNMGTTASVVKIWEAATGERKAIIGNIGDSRVYVQRADGTLEPITLDDGVLSSRVSEERRREMQEKLGNVTDRSTLDLGLEALFDKRNEMSQYVGGRQMQPHLYVADMNPGDRVFITSDGVHDNLTNKEIADILQGVAFGEDPVKKMIEGASTRSKDKSHLRANPDDMSAIVVQIPGGKPPEAASAAPTVEPQTPVGAAGQPEGSAPEGVGASAGAAVPEAAPAATAAVEGTPGTQPPTQEQRLMPIVEAGEKWLRVYALLMAGKEGEQNFTEEGMKDWFERPSREEFEGKEGSVDVKDFLRERFKTFLENPAVKERFPRIVELKEKNAPALDQFVDRMLDLVDKPFEEQKKGVLGLMEKVEATQLAEDVKDATQELGREIKERGTQEITSEERAEMDKKIKAAEGKLGKAFEAAGKIVGLLGCALLLGFLLILMLELELAKKFIEKAEKGKGLF